MVGSTCPNCRPCTGCTVTCRWCRFPIHSASRCREANYVATVLHGLPENLLKKGDGRGGYLAFLGRISPEKAPDAAIRIAARAGIPLKIAAKVDRVDQEYFNTTVEAAARAR